MRYGLNPAAIAILILCGYIFSFFLIKKINPSWQDHDFLSGIYGPAYEWEVFVTFPSLAKPQLEGRWKHHGDEMVEVLIDRDGTCRFSESSRLVDLSGVVAQLQFDRRRLRSYITVSGRKYEVTNALGLLCVADMEAFGMDHDGGYITWKHWLIWNNPIPDKGFYLFAK